jgi:ubiquinone/menaquinone biosynthesis C-methylase UbiE
MKEIEETKKYYSKIAKTYNKTAGYNTQCHNKISKRMKIRHQNHLKGHDVLEIACGTGYWTEVIAKSARSVLAIDSSKKMIAQAKRRLASFKNVTLMIADAYKLDKVQGRYTAAYAHWWWSHMPKSRIRKFLVSLHKKLEPGALVLFSDHLAGYADKRVKVIYNKKGDRFEERILKNGKKYFIIKNFLTGKEANKYLAGLASNVKFKKYRGCWELRYQLHERDEHH